MKTHPILLVAHNSIDLVHCARTLLEKDSTLTPIEGEVKVHKVRPELVYETFECNVCGRVQFKYTEPPICTGPQYQYWRDWILDVNQLQVRGLAEGQDAG